MLAVTSPARAEDVPGAEDVRKFLDSAGWALSMARRDDWDRLQSPDFRAREASRARVLLAHAAKGNVIAAATVWLASGRRPDAGLPVPEFLQASFPPCRFGRVPAFRLDLPRVEELSVSGGSLEAVIQTVHDRTRIRASWDGKRFLVDDALHGARPMRANSPAARVFDHWRIALTTRDGFALFACLSGRKKDLLRKEHKPKGLERVLFASRIKDLLPILALGNELKQTKFDPGVDDAILRGPWTLGYASPTRQVNVAPDLPPVEILLEGKRWIVSTTLEDLLPLPPEK